MLKEGDKAPEFKLPSDEGGDVTLREFRGKRVVLYFYPEDATPGCTQEACDFRDARSEFEKRGAVILGVSKDTVESHQEFKKKFRLNFPLLADTSGEVVEAYGVWGEKVLFGNRYMGIFRTTFVIDEKGRVQRVFPRVHVENHWKAVLEALEK